MIMYWNKIYEENEMIDVEQGMTIKVARDFSTKIALVFILITTVKGS